MQLIHPILCSCGIGRTAVRCPFCSMSGACIELPRRQRPPVPLHPPGGPALPHPAPHSHCTTSSFPVSLCPCFRTCLSSLCHIHQKDRLSGPKATVIQLCLPTLPVPAVTHTHAVSKSGGLGARVLASWALPSGPLPHLERGQQNCLVFHYSVVLAGGGGHSSWLL